MKKLLLKISVGVLILIIFYPSDVHAQSTDTTLKKLITLRDNFINQIKDLGFTHTLPAPRIVLDNPRSFGNYDSAENTLHTTEWKTLPPEAQKVFVSLAARLGNGETGEEAFEKSTHQWIFVHELGHWWRACTHQKALPYDEEMAANRIATAYWREHDSSFMIYQLGKFQNFIKNFPNPVPMGQSNRDFLNNNYDKLPGGPTYTWFQSEMIVEAYNEKPKLTFKEAIKNSGNPK
jgi:hypothetical protein